MKCFEIKLKSRIVSQSCEFHRISQRNGYLICFYGFLLMWIKTSDRITLKLSVVTVFGIVFSLETCSSWSMFVIGQWVPFPPLLYGLIWTSWHHLWWSGLFRSVKPDSIKIPWICWTCFVIQGSEPFLLKTTVWRWDHFVGLCHTKIKQGKKD